ncbi:MAG: hypothetical protein ACRD2Z_01495 [Thermoanaerobaculia bacterium]
MTDFRVIGDVAAVETIAEGKSIRELTRLAKTYGQARWRKRKGVANVELANGRVRRVEVHWYEAHGVGRLEMKIKRYLE